MEKLQNYDDDDEEEDDNNDDDNDDDDDDDMMMMMMMMMIMMMIMTYLVICCSISKMDFCTLHDSEGPLPVAPHCLYTSLKKYTKWLK